MIQPDKKKTIRSLLDEMDSKVSGLWKRFCARVEELNRNDEYKIENVNLNTMYRWVNGHQTPRKVINLILLWEALYQKGFFKKPKEMLQFMPTINDKINKNTKKIYLEITRNVDLNEKHFLEILVDMAYQYDQENQPENDQENKEEIDKENQTEME